MMGHLRLFWMRRFYKNIKSEIFEDKNFDNLFVKQKEEFLCVRKNLKWNARD